MDELERFKREINLAEFAASEGYDLDRRESSRSSLVMRHGDGDKIIVATDEDDHGVFFSVKANASGSIIDFLQHRQGLNLGQVRKRLRAWLPVPFSFPAAPKPRPSLPKPQPVGKDRAALIAQWHRFAPYAGGYLEGRGLAPETVAAFADRLRLDERGNTAFRHDDRQGLAGWELKNRGFTGFAAGGSKALFAGRAGVTPDPRPALVLSFAGSLSPEQRELLAHVLTKHPAAEVITATDNDAQGEEFAAMVEASRPDARRAKPPKGKDWNDAIRP